MRIEIKKSTSYTFEWSFYDKNVKDIPASGTITITKPGGTSLVSETAVSIETDGTIKYTLDSSNTTRVDANYRIALEYQVGDVVHSPYYLFDIVETPLINEVRDEDLFAYLPELRDKTKYKIIETTSAGSTSTFISTDLGADMLDYKGGYCLIYIDDTTTHEASLTSYDQATYTATFSPAYSATISSGLKVSVRTSFQRFIDEAYDNMVHRDIRNKVKIAAGYIDSTVTRNLTVFKTLENICFYKVESEGDKWDIRAKKFMQMYKDELVKLNEPYDYDEDGQIDKNENDDRPSFLNKGIVR